ncbi:MAG: protein translocase subunit SecF [Acidobacteria bacterium]|nr:protein translocase subunit SecF [Acidobacteriota bacterium]
MELFKNLQIDWISKKWIFVTGSILISLAGIVSLVIKGGPRYGIDFRGGTQVSLKFKDAPPLNRLRDVLVAQGLGEPTLQQIGEVADNELLVSLDMQATDNQLDAGRQAIVKALQQEFNVTGSKSNFNEIGTNSIAQVLAQSPALAVGGATPEQITAQSAGLAQRIVAFRDAPPRNGMIAAVGDLRGVEGASEAVIDALEQEFQVEPYAVRNVEIVGPKVGAALRMQALNATLLGLLAMLVYIAFRFELVYGVAAVLATFHDVIIAIGFLSIFDYEISLTVIAALLTLVGYSVNDTIVIFDRIRENLRLNRREPLAPMANRSINQTMSRTILTSGLTFLSVLSLYLFGGDVLRGFAFTLVVGILVGTYSSFSVAAPFVVSWLDYVRVSGGRGGMAAERVRGAGKRAKIGAGAKA